MTSMDLLPKGACVHELFEEQAARNPDAVAVVFRDARLTYGDLNTEANRVAHYLVGQGVGPDTLVGLCLESSCEMFIGLLGILKAGGAYVPIDPAYPAARIRHILDDTGIELLLTESHLLSALAFAGLKVLPLDAELRRVFLSPYSDHNIENGHTGRSPKHLAYVIYTSGSTGKPKGVTVAHDSLVDSTLSRFTVYRESPTSFALFSSYAFDSSVAGIFWTLLAAGKLCIVDLKDGLDPQRVANLMEAEQVSHFLVLPSVYAALLQAQVPAPQSLRTVIVAGEACSRELVQRHRATHGWNSRRLVNEYGPTEACVWSTYYDCSRYEDGPVPIGWPVPHARLHVLDKRMKRCPIGVAGELYIGGTALARGYLNQAGLTASKFVPRAASSNDVLYRTGDLVRVLPTQDGRPGPLEFLGRIDRQVKVRGFRIEPDEIEAVLTRHAAVSEAVVVARGEPRRLVAYLVAPDGGPDLIESLRSEARRNLPEYMTPAVFVLVEKLPLTPNGKVDREALPDPDLSRESWSAYVAPQTELERELCGLWQQVLQIERVGITDNFFAIGGDSIQSVKLVALAKQRGRHLAVKDIFTAQTVRALAALIESGAAAQEQAPDMDPFAMLTAGELEQLKMLMKNGVIEDAYPLSTLQQGMIYHNQLSEERGTYHDIISFRLAHAWSQPAFERALRSLMQQNELLRSIVLLEGARPLHLIYRDLDLPLQVEDLRSSDAAAQNAALDTWRREQRTRPFDWQRPLWAVTIHRLAERSFQFTLSCHHALLDGWSVATLITELFALYQRAAAGGDLTQYAPLPYRHFVAQELTNLQAGEHRDYWARALENAELPWWTGSPKSTARYSEWTLPSQRMAALHRLSAALGVPERAVFLTAHLLLLGLINGKERVTSSVVFHGRPERLGSERTLGLFLNALPLKLERSTGTWSELIRAVHEQMAAALPHRHYPLAQIQRDTGLDFAGALFDCTDFHVYDDVKHDLAVSDTYGFVETNYLFVFNCAKDVHSQTYRLSLTMDRGIFDEDFAGRIQRYLTTILDAALESPDELLEARRLLGERETQKLVFDWNASARERVEGRCIQELFEEQVESAAEAVAVSFGERQLSYAQLNVEANRVAHYLREQGVGAGSLVGLCLERSVETLIGLLGILKAGGAYVPIDPGHPPARIRYVIEDAALEIVLTEQQLLAVLPLEGLRVLPLDEPMRAALLSGYSSENIGRAQLGLSSSDLAYVIYTSGSTGQPKGVMVEHEGVCNLVRWQAHYYGVQPQSRVAQFASYSFDGSVGETFMALANGARLVMLERQLSPRRLMESLNEQAIETLVMVPSLLKELDPTLIADRERLTVVAVGEACPVELAQKWSRHCRFRNGYGPTECTVYSHIWAWPEAAQGAAQLSSVPIGRPIDNIAGYVLDERGRPVPEGVVGELYLSGVGLARGYLNRPHLTAERFVGNPLIETPLCTYRGELSEASGLSAHGFDAGRSGQSASAVAEVLPADQVMRLLDGRLQSDLLAQARAFIEKHGHTKPSYECFQRYVMEAVNESYAASGIGTQVLATLVPADDYPALRGVDFGFGNGEVLAALRKLGATAVGLDINPLFVENARRSGLSARMAKIDVEPQLFEAESGLARASQDFVLTTLTLDRMEQPVNLLKNMFDVLKTGGRFAIQTLLPIVGIEDGDIDNPVVYTAEEHRLTPGANLAEDKAILSSLIARLGGGNIDIYKLPYLVRSRDGVQRYEIWSLCGRKEFDWRCAQHGVRAYRTGDLVRSRADGNIEFVGRIDHQVKVRGVRIELAEIESVLLRHAAVSQAVVVASGEPQRLIAYLEAAAACADATHEAALADSVRAQLAAALPDYMVPAAFVVMERLPLTTSGKVDRNALLVTANAGAPLAREYVAPQTSTEVKLCRIWERLLGTESVGATDSFFEIGGHSLLAVRLVSELRSSYAVDLNVRALFEDRTVRALAARIDRAVRLRALAAGNVAIDTLSEQELDSYLELLSADEEVQTWTPH